MNWSSVVDHYMGIGDDILLLDFFCYTVTLPERGVLTVEDAVRRLGRGPAGLHAPPYPYLVDQDHDLTLVQMGAGVATIDHGCLGVGPAVSGRLAGPGLRHWYAAWDIDGNTFLASRQPQGGGYWSHPAGDDDGDHGTLTPYSASVRLTYLHHPAKSPALRNGWLRSPGASLGQRRSFPSQAQYEWDRPSAEPA
ncbi:hypothetical protein FHU36_001664 [Nonomuraea muscovyensis]|uniref:Uncharacterized protein n=1 Tax=Nonomuraea muscovyensis TaxID=1124761 RepID=A0A7X0EXU4_9ACTN|nr:hypothetical protein [Nonomuraea muscovyensis]MBB6345155.1 hypothetical protein [Nonomuraea muscovyensis]